MFRGTFIFSQSLIDGLINQAIYLVKLLLAVLVQDYISKNFPIRDCIDIAGTFNDGKEKGFI